MRNSYQERLEKLEQLQHQLGRLRQGAVYGHLTGGFLLFLFYLLCR
jgi:hypothetical protein